MKLKKFFIAVGLAATASVTVFSGCRTSPYLIFKRATGVSVPECGAVTTVDKTGWNGDGEIIYTFVLDEENGQKFETTVQSAVNWRPLPMTATLDELVYIHFDGEIPRAENGYYFFYDEQHKTHADDLVSDAYSYDFVIGMYDKANYTVYYYEQHT